MIDEYTESVIRAQHDESMWLPIAVEKNMDMVYKFCHGFNIPGMSFEDKASELKITLIKAIRTWGAPTRHRKKGVIDWAAFLIISLRHARWRLEQNWQRKDVAYHNIKYLEEIPVDIDKFEDGVYETIEWPPHGVSLRDMCIFEMHVFLGMTYEYIARVIGNITLQRCQQIYKRLRKMLLKQIDDA